MQPMDLTAYRDLWKTHGVMALLASALIARMPVMATMVPLSFLAKDAAGNFGWAGVVAGAYSVGMAVASVVWSRLADRKGARWVADRRPGWRGACLMAVVALLPYSWYRLLPVAAALAGAVRRAGHLGLAGQLAAAGAGCATAGDLRAGRDRAGAAVRRSARCSARWWSASPVRGPVCWRVPRRPPRRSGGSVSSSGRRLPHEESDGPRPTARQLLFHRHRLGLLIAFACMVTASRRCRSASSRSPTSTATG